MSREILFKAKRKGGTGWVEGDYVNDSILGETIRCRNGIFTEIDPSTVCQYTGLTDRNGMKIWEGDIIQGSGRRYAVMYYNDRAAFMRVEINVNVCVYLSRYSMRNEFEVVGNRWDNIELLKYADENAAQYADNPVLAPAT